MLYLFWGLLNTGLFIFFLAICFRATKLIREKFGLLASIVFVFGLFSFMGHSNNNNGSNSNQLKTWTLTSGDSQNKYATFLSVVKLEKTWISQYDLNVEFSKDKEGQFSTPISATSSTTGFISGTNWKPMAVYVNKTKEDTKFSYFVTGIVEWNLLGMTIYAQAKEYKGILSTK